MFSREDIKHIKGWQVPLLINTDKPPTYGRALALLKQQEGGGPPDVQYRQIKYLNNIIECDHGKLKRIISATIKGIEVMRALRKGQAESFYSWRSLGEMRLVSSVFEDKIFQ